MNDLTYLLPEEILEFGVSTARTGRSDMIKGIQFLLGYLHPGSARRLTRTPAPTSKHAPASTGTGARNPIHRYEGLLSFFVRHNRAAAILMGERWRYFYEVNMATQQTNTAPFDPALCEEQIDALTASLRRRLRAGELPRNELAQLEATAHELLEQITDDQIRAERERRARPKDVPPVNWRTGQRGL